MATDLHDDPPLVGREEELDLLTRYLTDESLPPVLHLYGAPGIGKTEIMHELRRRHPGLSWAWYEAAHLTEDRIPMADVVVIDGLHPRLSVLVRDRLAPAMLGGARVLVASRRPPEPEWLDQPTGSLVVPVELSALDDAAAETLLSRFSIDPDRLARLIAWAAGEPLALTLAGRHLDTAGALTLEDLAARFEDRLLALDREVASESFDDDLMAVLELAAVATALDEPAVEAALPDVDGRALEELGELSVARSVGSRLAVTPRLRWAIQTRLRVQRPDRLRELTRRLSDHAAHRARAGERNYLLELAEMVADDDLRWGIGSDRAARFRTDSVRPSDADSVQRFLSTRPRRWASLRRWLDEAPGHVQTIRSEGGDLAGLSVSLSTSDAPDWAEGDPHAGPWLEYARSHHAPDEATLLRDSLIMADGAERSEIVTVGNGGLGTGRAFTARWLYVLIESDDEDKERFVQAMGYERFESLDVVDPEFVLHCYRLDLGPDGLVGTTHALVYRHLGYETGPPRLTPVTRSDVIEALRNFHQPTSLLTNPLGGEARGEKRVTLVRQRILRAIAEVSSDDPLDRLRKEAVQGAYLETDSSHGAVAHRLHLSRATYFRRLAEGVEKVVANLVEPSDDRTDRTPPNS